jgi:hypothetical protein
MARGQKFSAEGPLVTALPVYKEDRWLVFLHTADIERKNVMKK